MVSNYFSSGNVYVIDDVFEEAKPIIDSLYNFQIPHLYSDGSRSSLPKVPVQVRLIFLDLNLKPTVNPNDKKSFMDMHATILNQLLDNNSSSYIVLVWSKEEETLLPDFKEMLLTENYKLTHRQPLDIIELNKKDYFQNSTSEEGDSMFTWKPGMESQLFEVIKEKLNNNKPFKTLASWETIIKKSSNKTVDYIFELVQNAPDKKKKLNELITCLSISYLGKDNFFEKLKGNNESRTDGFLFALTELIDDEIEKEIYINSQYGFTDWTTEEEFTKINQDFKSRLNSKFLISKKDDNNELTGSVYRVSKTKHSYIEILNDCFELGKLKSFVKAHNEKVNNEKGPAEQLLSEKNYLKRKFRKHVNSNIFIPIELNITPLCDIVQKKEKYSRLIPGILIKSDYYDCLKRASERDFQSPIIYLDAFNDSYKLVLDYRFFHSAPKKEILKMDKLFTLRKNFVDDIQLKLSNHVSRLGVLNL